MNGVSRTSNPPSISEQLRSLAQNEYMIDQHYLADGHLCNEAADEIERLRAALVEIGKQPPGEAKTYFELMDRVRIARAALKVAPADETTEEHP